MIKAIVIAHYSERDACGNTYWAMSYVDTKTRQTVHGTISGGESNIDYAMRKRFGASKHFYFIVQSHKKREFKQLTKNWQYAGCTDTDINSFIDKMLKAEGER